MRAIVVSPCRCGVVGTTTAFGLRRDRVPIEIFATFVDRWDKEEEQRHRQWARATRQAFASMALPGGYLNLLAGDDAERAAESYGPNAERLVEAKRHYDPGNVFCSAIALPASKETANAY
jgi:Berberine and berberine like